MTDEIRLQWIAEPFINQSDPIQFAASALVGRMLMDMSRHFRANVTSVTRNGGVSDLTSQLTVT